MTKMLLNDQLKGVEIYFDQKPAQFIIDSLKSNGFRWHNVKKCWYAKQSEKTMLEAQKLTESQEQPQTEELTITPTTKEQKPKETKNNLSLWESCQWSNMEVNNKQDTKAMAAEMRKHVKTRFPMCKFSIRSDYNSIHFYIVSSPYEKDSEYLQAIKKYCDNLINAYRYCTCYDPYGDYGSSYNFYGSSSSIDYEYKQTEQTESIKSDMLDFDTKQIEANKAEELRKEQEFQAHLAQIEEDKIRHQEYQKEEARQVEIIYNSINVELLEESKQYFVLGSQFAKLNKNNTLDQYKEEVEKGEFYLQNVKITKEIHFTSKESLDYFSNLLLNDFTFLEQTGGSYTDDKRFTSMTDYYQMTEEERETVIFNLYGVAIFYNNQLQFVVDTQGYSYSRYVGLVDNVTISKTDNVKQLINPKELNELKIKAQALEDYSITVITDNNLINVWNTDKWNEYRNIMKEELKKNNFRLTKSIIQQLPEESETLKTSMYKLLVEVDGIQDQFKNANLKQGQKITLFYISDFGSIVNKQITFDKVEYTKYAQYDNAVKLIFTPKGKRKQYYNYFHSTVLVYNGWLDLNEEVLHTKEVSNDFVITKTKYFSCDKKQYDEILEHFETQGIKPIINTYKPTF